MTPELDPQQLQHALLGWYDRHKRDLPWRRTDDPYAIWISEAMLQQTRVETVIPYYHRFMTRFPDPATLAAADLQEVLKQWEGLGYYSRARNLHRAAAILVERHGGRLPDDMEALRLLPGIGAYTAAAVLSIAFNQPFAVVDGNVKRVLARLLQIESPVNKPSSHPIFQKEADRLLCRQQPADYNQALMELGALVCKPKNPECGICPVGLFCNSHRSGTVSAFPVRIKKPRTPHRRRVVAVIIREKDDHVLIVQRPEEGLLGGLWEFPGIGMQRGENAMQSCATSVRERTGLAVTPLQAIGTVRHTYTHFRLTAEAVLCVSHGSRVNCPDRTSYKWLPLAAIRQYPLHRAAQKVLALAATLI